MGLTDKEILEQAREHYKTADEGWRDIYRLALDDMRFAYNIDDGQWPDDVRRDRKGRPMLTINKLLKFVRRLRGEAAQNRPRISVIPVDDRADPPRAKLYDGLIRQIEYLSDAPVAYDTAYLGAVSGSVGFFRIVTEYEDEWSFNQDIRIKRITNPFSVHLDPAAREFTLTDGNFAFVEDYLTDKEFKRKFPAADPTNFRGGPGEGQGYDDWFSENKIRIAEYFYKDTRPAKIALVETLGADGKTWVRGPVELTKAAKEQLSVAVNQKLARVLDERDTTFTTVRWCKLNGAEVIEKRDWAGKHIPIIPMFGDEVVIDGKRHILSLIRDAKGPQQMYNYWSSAATETMALAPKVPFIVAAKQIEGFEPEWEDANTKNRMYIRYKPIPGLQKPSREQQIQIPTGIVAMMQNTAAELEDQLGLYEASKGAPSNERSGRAIMARVAQSDKGTFVFFDNEARAIIYAGRQLIDLIPKIYDTKRALQVRGEDGEPELVQVNVPTGRTRPDGQPELENDLTVGKYDLISTVGASYSSRRQEMVEMMIQSMQYAPQLAAVIAPLVFKYSDWPGANEVEAELKKLLAAMPAEATTGGT